MLLRLLPVNDRSVLNRTITLNDMPMTIVGVAPPGFFGIVVGENPDVMVPLMMKAQMTPTWNDLQNRPAHPTHPTHSTHPTHAHTTHLT